MTCICNLPMVVFVLQLEINLMKVLFSSDLTLELHIVIQVITGVLTVTVTTERPSRKCVPPVESDMRASVD